MFFFLLLSSTSSLFFVVYSNVVLLDEEKTRFRNQFAWNNAHKNRILIHRFYVFSPLLSFRTKWKKNIRAVSKQIIWVTVPKGFSVASRPDTSGLFFANVISNYMSERDKYCVIHFYHRCTHSHAAAAVAFIN